MRKQTLYVDMDGVLVDFNTGINRLSSEILENYSSHPEDAPGVFALMDPIPGALEALDRLRKKYDIYLLSTAPWNNLSAWSDKVNWVKIHMDPYYEKRVILCHNKSLLKGSFLIDDRSGHGAEHFEGEWIHFGSSEFPDWNTVLKHFNA